MSRELFARLLLAHGAGAPMDSPFMESLAGHLADQGIETLRFEFPYMAERRFAGRKRPPDRQPVLLQCWQEQIEHCDSSGPPLFIGGKSMGGRMATLLAAQTPQTNVRAVVCFGYPFHPPGKPDKLRIEHLQDLSLPTLIIQGSRDRLGARDLVETLPLGGNIQIHWLESADHDLRPLQRSELTAESALRHAAEAARAFMLRVISPTQAEAE